MKRPRGGPSRFRSMASMPGNARRRSAPASADVIASAPRVDFGFDRRRRRGEHHRNAGAVRAHHRHVAGVVVHAVLLLVGGVVLLVDDDEAEIGIGQEQRRARAGDDRHLAGSDRRPGAGAHARRQLRMPFRRAHAEALGEAVEELRGERDLRHQDQRLAPAPDGLGHRLEIDLGLAGAGDAVDQRRRIAARRRRWRAGRRPPRAAPARNRACRNPGRAPGPPAPAAAPQFPACRCRPARR